MPAPISNDLRKRVVKAVDGGMSCNAAAARFDVSISTVVKLMQHVKKTGGYEPKPKGHRNHKLAPYRANVEAMLKEKPDITLMEMQKKLRGQHIHVAVSTVDVFLKHIGKSFKKNGTRA